MTAMSVAPCNPDEEEDEFEAAAVALLEGEDEEGLLAEEELGTDIAAIEELAALVVAGGVDLAVVTGVFVVSTRPETTAPALNEFIKPPTIAAGAEVAAGVGAALVAATGAVVTAGVVGTPATAVAGVLAAAALAVTASAVPLFAAAAAARTTSSILFFIGRGVS